MHGTAVNCTTCVYTHAVSAQTQPPDRRAKLTKLQYGTDGTRGGTGCHRLRQLPKAARATPRPGPQDACKPGRRPDNLMPAPGGHFYAPTTILATRSRSINRIRLTPIYEPRCGEDLLHNRVLRMRDPDCSGVADGDIGNKIRGITGSASQSGHSSRCAAREGGTRVGSSGNFG